MPLRGERVGEAYVSIYGDGDPLHQDIKEALSDADGDVEDAGDRHSRTYLNKWSDNLDVLSTRIDDISVKSGRLFGKGSRNNFLNFLGAAVEGSVRLIALLPRMAKGLIDLGTSMGDAFVDAGGGFQGLLASVTLLGPMLLKGGAALATFAIALPAIVGMLAVMSTLLTAIVGTLIALAGTVIFAAIAGIFALGGALTVAAIGAAAVVAGIAGMSDAQKEMVTNATEPLVNAFKDLAAASARGLFSNIEQQAKRLTPVLRSFEPLFFKIGRAVSRVGDSIVDSLDSPQFNNFRKQMEVFLPNAVRTLGETVNNVFGGLGGVFLAMRPFLRNFLGWLEDITQEFSDWANSKKGRDEIRAFLEDAADSAKSLGDFLVKVVDLVFTLFDLGGRETGDSMFDSMTRNIEEFIAYLEANPDAVKDFFEDAQDIAEDIGDIIIKIGELIGILDDLTGHPIVSGFFNVLIWAFENTAKALRFIGAMARFANNQLEDLDDTLRDLGGDAKDAANLLGTAFTKVPGIIRGIVGRIPKLVANAFDGLPGMAARAAARLVSPFTGLAGKILKHIDGLPGRVRNLFNQLGQIASSVIGKMVSPFAGIVGKIFGHISGLPARIREMFHNILGFISGIPGRIVGMFAGLAGKILSAIGRIDIGSLIDIPDPGSGVPWVPGIASGKWFGNVTNGPMLRWVGEDGPEAIVPLARDLSRVDPSVRWLSAIAQGKDGGMADGGLSTGKTIDASGWIIQSPGDPEQVAQEVVNRLFAQQF